MVEEFAREGEVTGSNPGRRKVCKNREKNAATIEWVCGGQWGPPRIKNKFAIFFAPFS